MTLENSQPKFWQETELPLMSSRAASLAKMSALQESKPELVKAQGQGFGPKSSDLLASYDRNSSSWRTSQTCLLAQAESLADGLAEYSETWPSAGMMRSGKTYRRQPWALPIAENVSGLLPTPSKADNRSRGDLSHPSIRRRMRIGKQIGLSGMFVGQPCPMCVEGMMGFPRQWTELQPLETP